MHIVRVNQVNPIKQIDYEENYKLGTRATLTTWTKQTTYIHIIQSVVNQVSRVNQVSLLVARAQPGEAARGGSQGRVPGAPDHSQHLGYDCGYNFERKKLIGTPLSIFRFLNLAILHSSCDQPLINNMLGKFNIHRSATSFCLP